MIGMLAACVIVLPMQNVGIDHGRVVAYRDMGDRIVYATPPSRDMRWLVERVQGTGMRVACRQSKGSTT